MISRIAVSAACIAGLVRALGVEQPLARVAHDVLHGELQVDDVLVVREHQRFLEHARLDVVAVADFQRPHLREVDDLVRLHRPGQPPVQSRSGLRGELAERQHDAALSFHDDVEPAGEPHREHDSREQPGAAQARSREEARRLAAASAAAPAEQLAEAAVEVAPQLVEVGRALIAAAGPREPPWRPQLGSFSDMWIGSD
jgi:hypothetical protein